MLAIHNLIPDSKHQVNACFHDALVLLPDAEMKSGVSVTVSQGRITRISSSCSENDLGMQHIDASGWLILPGMINAHCHSAMGFLRNKGHLRHELGAGVSTIEAEMFPAERMLDPELVEALAYPFIIAGLRGGTTCFVDHYYYASSVARAMHRIGVRGFVGETIADLGGPFATDDRWRHTMTQIDSWDVPGVRPMVAPHAMDTVSRPLLEAMVGFARSRDLGIHVHMSQTAGERARVYEREGASPVQVASDIGLLGERTIAAHLVSASPQDLRLFSSSGAALALCPGSQILYERLAPLEEMVACAARLVIGTDCAACGDSPNLLQERRLAGLLLRDRGVVDELTVVLSTDTNAARALGMPGQLGVICEGACADLVFVKPRASHRPFNNPGAWIVYTLEESDVRNVMIDGYWVLWEKQALRVSEEEIEAHYEDALMRLASRRGSI
ncbi:MAG TPA: amidohydrolase family protein [Kofleriaceae bacterium]